MRIITAREGYIYRRIHDGFIMGKTIHLGIDHSTGSPREDKEEYYEEVVQMEADMEDTNAEGEEGIE